MNPSAQRVTVQLRAWRAPLIGLGIGLAYGAITSAIDLEELKAPRVFFVLDSLLTVLLPCILGTLAGMVFNYLRRQERTAHLLSTQNANLQGEMLTHLLGSHVLHEIRNPLHNLMAVLEEWQQRLPPEESSIVQRNVLRLQAVTNQLRRWSSLKETVNLRQTVPFGPWLDEFLTDKVRPQIHKAGIHLEERLEPVVVDMHPLLLEQCFVPLFNNALEAVMDHRVRVIRLSVSVSRERAGYVQVDLSNSGAAYPAAVLAAQVAQPLSDYGPGLGLLLVRRTLEQVDGELQLSNVQGQACTAIWIPGRAE